MSYCIIKRHGGGIDVENIPGQGTTFTLPIESVEGEKNVINN
ncbi:MAG: hypothetical protein HOG03_00390 [Desulfobacula sp.]|nr:hypothetical protein [Desulfobacula sp.]MBT3483847.1 hypothetical protein [Desulfobacula sp.]MBT3803035.1 hypothetical protein [Desulfobacula sp.]MBT4023452.1 hypothetical protein [Desulfobacula sp.]MBT4197083.1 hypothetical protein [Desulfobacula sp.]